MHRPFMIAVLLLTAAGVQLRVQGDEVEKERLRQLPVLVQANAAWTSGKFAEVRNLCQDLIALQDTPSHVRSYAHLRIAQSYLAEGNHAAARLTYEAIARAASYPAVHRYEARESVKELGRLERGLPAPRP